MILDSIKEQFKKKGFWKTIEFYFCRVMSKAALKVVGKFALLSEVSLLHHLSLC